MYFLRVNLKIPAEGKKYDPFFGSMLSIQLISIAIRGSGFLD